MSDILSSQTGPESIPGCSTCKSNGQVIKIVYGDPMPNSNVTELAQKGLIKLGGGWVGGWREGVQCPFYFTNILRSTHVTINLDLS